MPLMIKLNRNVVRVYLCLDNGHFITVYQKGNKWEQQNGYTVLYARIKQEQKSERILS